MSKRRLTLEIPLPPYRPPRNSWRRLIHEAALSASRARSVHYSATDKLEVHVTLDLSPSATLVHDVDNRLKDVLDALQGRTGGPKKLRVLEPVIPNDNQIYRVSIEKSPPSDGKRPHGKITIKKLRSRSSA